jgi:hypothetical protein
MATSIFSEQLGNLWRDYSSVTLIEGEKLELEVRFGHKKAVKESKVKRAKRQVTRDQYTRVLNYLRASGEPQLKEYEVFAYSKDVRRTVFGGVTVWQIKSIKRRSDYRELQRQYGIKTSLSSETPKTSNFPHLNSWTVDRKIKRYSLAFRNNYGRVDVSEVYTHDINNPNTSALYPAQSYEVEVEFTGRSHEQLKAWSLLVDKIWTVFFDSRLIFTEDERVKLLNRVNSFTGSNNPVHIDKNALVEPRPLNITDMVYGGVVGNAETSYSVTIKADGERRLLCFDTTGIWLVYPFNNYNLINRSKKPNIGMVFDGELMAKGDYNIDKEVAYFYVISDCIGYKGRSLVNRPFRERLRIVQEFSIDNPLLKTHRKPYRDLDSPTNFYTAIQELFDIRKMGSFKNDGLIFVPNNSIYNVTNRARKAIPETQECKRRSLTIVPDVCKWKPLKSITIDFHITVGKKFGIGGVEIPFYVLSVGREIPAELSAEGIPVTRNERFVGTKDHPYNGSLFISDEFQGKLVTGMIVECSLFEDTKAGFKGFKIERIRRDRTAPNRECVAIHNWRDLMGEAVTKKMLLGRSLVPVFKYHNRIKKKLLKRGRGTLLDIGSGMGGDIGKWEKYDQIWAVEPNLEFSQELSRRLQTSDIKQRVIIINKPAEDPTLIKSVQDRVLDRKADVVSLMLSLSFFYENEKKLEALVSNILALAAPSCQILFLTIDGDAVSEAFKRATSSEQIRDELDFKTAIIRKGEGSKIYTTISESKTVTGRQEEYLVFVSDLIRLLSVADFTLEFVEQADEEPFFSKNQISYSSLYCYGVFRRGVKERETRPIIAPLKPPEPKTAVALEPGVYRATHPSGEVVQIEEDRQQRVANLSNFITDSFETLMGRRSRLSNIRKKKKWNFKDQEVPRARRSDV